MPPALGTILLSWSVFLAIREVVVFVHAIIIGAPGVIFVILRYGLPVAMLMLLLGNRNNEDSRPSSRVVPVAMMSFGPKSGSTIIGPTISSEVISRALFTGEHERCFRGVSKEKKTEK